MVAQTLTRSNNQIIQKVVKPFIWNMNKSCVFSRSEVHYEGKENQSLSSFVATLIHETTEYQRLVDRETDRQTDRQF